MQAEVSKMSIGFVGPNGSFEVPWIRYALLRDNVMHHLDNRGPSLRFVSLYSVAASLGGNHVTVNAQQLGEEASEIAERFGSLSSSQLAISARTQAVLRFDPMLPVNSPTEIVGNSISLPWIDTTPETLGAIFKGLLSELQRITRSSSELDTVEVIDG